MMAHCVPPFGPPMSFHAHPLPRPGFGVFGGRRVEHFGPIARKDYSDHYVETDPCAAGWGGLSKNSSKSQNGAKKEAAAKSDLPLEKRRTVKCTGIPTTVHLGLLAKHFSDFGNVVSIQIKSDPEGTQSDGKQSNMSLVQFDSHKTAMKCVSSPTPVLNNRFITVAWSDTNPDSNAASLPSPPASPTREKSLPQPAPQEIIRLEVPASEKPLSTKAKLLKQQLEGARHLYDRMMENGMPDEKREKMEASLLLLEEQFEAEVSGTADSSVTESVEKKHMLLDKQSELEQLKAKLAVLEKNASKPKIPLPLSVPQTGFPPANRGGFHGRSMGTGRGRGHGRFSSRLDLRTKTVKVKGIPKDCPPPKLRSHFIMFGLLDKVTQFNEIGEALVVFQERLSAEMALVKGTSLGGIPLTIEWYDPRLEKVQPKQESETNGGVMQQELTEKPLSATEESQTITLEEKKEPKKEEEETEALDYEKDDI